jgi:Protein of unknown function (DUF3301)
MELGWTALALLILASALVWFWQNSLAARECANAAAIEACERLNLQFLDGTVAFARLEVVRGMVSLVTLRRTYVFDYTANSIERRQGFVVVSGRRMDSVGFARGEDLEAMNVSPVTPERPVVVQQLPPAANVLSIEEWRARQRTATDKSSNPRPNRTNAGE